MQGVWISLLSRLNAQNLQPVPAPKLAVSYQQVSHRLRRAGLNVAVGPDGDPLRMHGRRVGLEVTELPLLL